MNKQAILFSFLGLMLLSVFQVEAQKKKRSPAATVEAKAGDAAVVINYHQPSARGRKIMGGLVPYGQVWRTGANNATTIEVDRDVMVEGQTLPKGKYALFTIPGKNEWIVIFNKKHDQWGHFNYNEEDDQLRVTVKPEKSSDYMESFVIDMANDGDVKLGWENTEVKFNIDN